MQNGIAALRFTNPSVVTELILTSFPVSGTS